MSWNGSDLSSSRPGSPSVPARPTRRPRVLFLALVLILLGAAALYFLVFRAPALTPSIANPQPSTSPSHIANTTPTLAPTNLTHAARTAPSDTSSPAASDKSSETASSSPTNAPRNVIVNDGSLRPRDRYAVLKANSDRQIAMLVYSEPGQLIIGSVDFDEDFEQEFKESLKTKLVPAEDATEEDREMIEAVNEARETIVKAMREEHKTAGEILAETRKQLRELYEYKSMLKEEIVRYENDEEKTDDDVSDLFDAANKILKENDMPPFEPNDLTRELVRQSKFDKLEKEEKEKENN